MRSSCQASRSSADLKAHSFTWFEITRQQNCVRSPSRPRKVTMSPSHPDCRLARRLCSKAWTKFRTERELTYKRQGKRLTWHPAGPRAVIDRPYSRAAAEADAANEYFEAVYPSPRGDFAAHGRSLARRRRRVSTTTGFGAPSGGLSDHSSRDVLSRREPGGHVLVGHGAARAPVRTSARLEADDLDKLVCMFGDHASILARTQHRYRRTGSASSNQRRRNLSPPRSPESTHLQQSQSRGYAYSDAGPDFENAAAAESRRSRRHDSRSENFAIAGRGAGPYQRRTKAWGTYSSESHG